MVFDKGYFIYYGDFNAQQIPFYRLAHDSILSGNIKWIHLTDLGSNFIGSYSFYLLTSPFFLITLLLPSSWVAYSMGPLLILKLSLAALSGYIYLRRYVRDRRWAVVGGLLYAFSAFSVYNIFYFHFHEPIIIFPLLLAAVDEFHYTGRKGVVALTVFASAILNYYFFFGQAVFVLIYFIIRCITKTYRFRIKSFLLLAAECIIGFSMSMFIMLPSLAAITGNYRVSEFINGWTALLYNTKRYLQILVALLFPGDIPAKLNFVPDAGAQWSSIAAYIPMFSMVFVIAYIRKSKKSFLKILFIVLVIMAAVPALNSMFQAMNSSYYARWFYMLTLVMAMMTVRGLDNIKDVNFFKGFVPTAVMTVAIALIIGLTPYESFKNSVTTLYKLGLEDDPLTFWIFVGISVFGLAAVLSIYLIQKKKPRLLFRLTAITLSVFIVGYSSYYLWIGKANTDHSDEFIQKYALNYGEDIDLEDIREVRSDFYETQDNLGMYWQVPNIQGFHSVVPSSILEFYNKSGEKRDVASRPAAELYGFRALLSVKYLFAEPDSYTKKDLPLVKGFKYLKTENGFDIFENEYYVPMGFTYDSFYSEEEYLDIHKKLKHHALLKGIVLSQYQMKKYSELTGYTEGMYLDLNSQFDENHLQNKMYPEYNNFTSVTSEFDYSEEAYYEDVEKLRKNTCSEFEYTQDGFKAVFENTGKDNLLFFSVPYDEGWTAYVNGKVTEIEKVNIGFMAVMVKGNSKSEIEFRYTTPKLKEGILISSVGAGVYIIYLLIIVIIKRKTKRCFRKKYRIKTDKATAKRRTT